MKALLSELAPYKNGDWVHHPLVICPLQDNPNHRYRQKKKLVVKAKADGDWNSYIFLHERPYRIGALEYAVQ